MMMDASPLDLCKTRAGSALTTNQLALDHGCGRKCQSTFRSPGCPSPDRPSGVCHFAGGPWRETRKEDFTLTSMIGMSAAIPLSIKPGTPSSPTQVKALHWCKNATRVGAPNMLRSARNKPWDHPFCISAGCGGGGVCSTCGGTLRAL
jgi:hypothetical protein